MDPTSFKQLKSILWKNWLLKRAHPVGFIAEIMLPVLFMALLILIKSITDVLTSPDVAYSCGNVYPWLYSASLFMLPQGYMNPFVCVTKPTTCSQDNYYQDPVSYPIGTTGDTVNVYTQYGYMSSPASSGNAFNPFYSYTLADDSDIYNEASMTNPSLPIDQLLSRLSQNNAIIAVASLSDDSTDASVSEAKAFASYLQSLGGGADSVAYFTSASEVETYITSVTYGDTSAESKIAFAIIFNSVNTLTASWDYSIRANFTNGRDASYPSVACLAGPTSNSSIISPLDGPNPSSSSSCQFTYSIPSTKFYTSPLAKPQSASHFFGYSYSGYATLQLTVDEYIFKQYNPAFTSIRSSVSLMPTRAYVTDNFQSVISSTLGIFYMLSFLYPVSGIIRSRVLDKETRIKEAMKMMGLSDVVYDFSWSFTTGLQMTVVSILITLVTAGSVFEFSNKALVFFYFLIFSYSIINMCFLLSTFFSRSKVASLLGPMIFFGSFFPYYAVNDPQFDTRAKTATCLLAPACFALGSTVFADYEGGMVGVQTDNMSTLTSNFSYTLCVTMLIFDTILYGILAWYFEKVLPSEFGTALPFYFPFAPSYWKNTYLAEALSSILRIFDKAPTPPISREVGVVGIRIVDEERIDEVPSSDVVSPLSSESCEQLQSRSEPVGADLLIQKTENKTISILNLRKTFATPDGERVAVDRLSLDLFEGQVTCLLGHNGAGKTTTISMLVGLSKPSDGDALVRGFKITEDMQSIRRNLGVCPQHDILFPELTVMQHLQMFAAFKGLSGSQVNDAAVKMIAEVGLTEKANVKSNTLSGGQKRKLSLGIALIGDSRVIILDEPTSGMDPYSRRSTWNIIQRNKKNRVILLTTHFMDEADILGDRIAIMAHGRLQCVGSSLFLKGVYGIGYTLTIVKKQFSQEQEKNSIDPLQATYPSTSNDSTYLTAFVSSMISNAEPLSDVGAEISFRLPFSSSAHFPALFDALDALKVSELGRNRDTSSSATSNVGIIEYGVSVTTLEEVFMRVGKEEQQRENISRPQLSIEQEPREESTPQIAVADRNYSETKFAKHFYALLLKRAIYGRRDRRMFLCQLVLPVLLVIIGVALLQVIPSLQQPDLILAPSTNQYNANLPPDVQNIIPFQITSDGGNGGSFVEQLSLLFNGQAIAGMAVAVDNATLSDAFDGCDQGAQPLQDMNNYLLSGGSVGISNSNAGSSLYGALTVSDFTNATQLVYNAMINSSANHGMGIYVNLVHTSFLQMVSGVSSATITVHNYPLPPTNQQQLESASASAFIVALFCMIAFCFIPASFATFIVKEREVKAKHQQVVSGVNVYAYWCSTLAWDVVSYLPTPLLLLAVVNAFGVDAYTAGDAAGCFAALLILFGPAVASFTYLISYVFSSHSSAQIMIMFLNFLTGLCLAVVSFVLTTINTTSEINLSLRYLYLLFPSFCLGDGILQLALCQDGIACPIITTTGFDFAHPQTPLEMISNNLVFLSWEIVVYFGFVLLIELLLTFPDLSSLLLPVRDPGLDPSLLDSEDDDVRREREFVQGGSADSAAVCINELRKVYPLRNLFLVEGTRLLQKCWRMLFILPRNRQYLVRNQQSSDSSRNNTVTSVVDVKVAIQSLSYHVSNGECFGFLGINGAGKTTTLSILSGEFPPTSGEAFIDRLNTATDQVMIRKRIGYCPQFDALLELLTVREHLELFGRIKGLTSQQTLKSVVDEKIKQLDLGDFEHKLAGSLSGGNRRKLSLGIALIGDPKILFLDEPSTGMDPAAKRFMWDVIAKVSSGDARCSVILTTHSMEEAEALCTRIGIIVNGGLKCIGSSQHLKERFGSGYEVQIKTNIPTDEQLETLRQRLAISSVVSLSRQDCERSCEVLGNSLRAQEIATNRAGASLHDILEADGMVPVLNFLRWWLNEEKAGAINTFILEQISPGSVLLERSTANRFRYSIPKPSVASGTSTPAAAPTSHLARIFDVFEKQKSALEISEYSVGQTTLEQIFNYFASSQENPENRSP